MKSVKDFELKLYEKLGVKKFRNILVKSLCFIFILPFVFSKRIKEELKEIFYNTPSNYFMKKGNGLKDLKDFKKKIYFNTIIHIVAMIPCITTILTGSIIYGLLLILINTYCIMLQRYNYIRINNTINKFKDFEEKQRIKLKEEIKENSTNHYIVHFKKKKNDILDKNINIDELFNLLTLNQLKKLKIDLMNYNSPYSDRFDTTIYSDDDQHKYMVCLTKKKKS